MYRNAALAVFIFLATVSCKKQDIVQEQKQQQLTEANIDSGNEISGRKSDSRSGVVLTFDDRSVDEWYDLHKSIAPAYQWKATFFVSLFSTLSAEKIRKLRNLQNFGHEIAGHGLNHIDAVQYIKENGAQSYIQNEITPMLRLMRVNGLRVVDFAYPYGSRDESTDELLLKYFQVLRGTTYSDNVDEVKNLGCYYKFNQVRVVDGLGIDDIYKNPLSYIKSVLRYAKENNKIVILYAHQPVPLAGVDQYQTSYSTIEEICKYVVQNKMKFYSMQDLYALK
ncbi:MAG: polysaccharide deacetylase family protein [Chitinophagaceae bacterium]|nr:polysaccharide deacetylase family protein [Chitinophagaceae bacterium]